MSNAILQSSNIRSNLLALQGTADLLNNAQAKLSTGKKVNSALDNPTSFFTSEALNDRATSLNSLLDGVSNGIQTVKAANTGLDTVTSLLKQAKAIATSAKADSGSTATGADSTKALNISTTGTTGTSIRDKTLSSKLSDNGIASGADVTFTQTKNGVTSAYTFTNTAGTKTVQDLVDGLNKSGVGSATVNDNGTITFSSNVDTSTAGLAANPTNAFTVAPTTPGAAGSPVLGFEAAVAATSKNTASASGQDYASQFSDIVQSINDAVKDASYNGTNLLAGGSNKLTVTFDANSNTKLDVASQDFSSSTILKGNTSLTGTNTQAVLDSIDSALSSVKGAQGTYGNKLAIMQTRQDFSKSLSTILQTGSDNLVAADTNLEAANVLALQTRQSLSQSALSLANQQNQGILQLLR
jgi:flagellin